MKTIILAAGGTGGHINAALSVGASFEKDHNVEYISGTRYLDFKLFQGRKVHHIKSQPLRTKNPVRLATNLLKNLMSFTALMFRFLINRPVAVIGAGGYVCGPTLMAAKVLFIPIFIIEQNAVMGVTNRILAKFANLIFTNFSETKGLSNLKRVRVVGNPIRSEINFTPPINSETVNLLVFGGSLGAEQINKVVKNILELDFPRPLKVVHQVGRNNLDETKTNKVEYHQCEYIDKMQAEYENCHMILARAGASTVSELRVVRRPTILIPFPFATDNHQYYNAMNLKKESDFPVRVLDYNKSIDELTTEVYDSILSYMEMDISSENKASRGVEVSSAEKIKKEILNYVWN